MEINFENKDAVIELYLNATRDSECLRYIYNNSSTDKLKSMSVKAAIGRVLEHADINSRNVETKEDIETLIENCPNYDVKIFDNVLSVNKDRNGNVNYDERDEMISEKKFWDLTEDSDGIEHFISKIKIYEPLGDSGLEYKL
ncbi:hypothetical protein KY334_08030 [Candidatus Woesearchaeota archaeon]|nr:hypothetical protein [Candidatus Woesearchaeota archaeon]